MEVESSIASTSKVSNLDSTKNDLLSSRPSPSIKPLYLAPPIRKAALNKSYSSTVKVNTTLLIPKSKKSLASLPKIKTIKRSVPVNSLDKRVSALLLQEKATLIPERILLLESPMLPYDKNSKNLELETPFSAGFKSEQWKLEANQKPSVWLNYLGSMINFGFEAVRQRKEEKKKKAEELMQKVELERIEKMKALEIERVRLVAQAEVNRMEELERISREASLRRESALLAEQRVVEEMLAQKADRQSISTIPTSTESRVTEPQSELNVDKDVIMNEHSKSIVVKGEDISVEQFSPILHPYSSTFSSTPPRPSITPPRPRSISITPPRPSSIKLVPISSESPYRLVDVETATNNFLDGLGLDFSLYSTPLLPELYSPTIDNLPPPVDNGWPKRNRTEERVNGADQARRENRSTRRTRAHQESKLVKMQPPPSPSLIDRLNNNDGNEVKTRRTRRQRRGSKGESFSPQAAPLSFRLSNSPPAPPNTFQYSQSPQLSRTTPLLPMTAKFNLNDQVPIEVTSELILLTLENLPCDITFQQLRDYLPPAVVGIILLDTTTIHNKKLETASAILSFEFEHSKQKTIISHIKKKKIAHDRTQLSLWANTKVGGLNPVWQWSDFSDSFVKRKRATSGAQSRRSSLNENIRKRSRRDSNEIGQVNGLGLVRNESVDYGISQASNSFQNQEAKPSISMRFQSNSSSQALASLQSSAPTHHLHQSEYTESTPLLPPYVPLDPRRSRLPSTSSLNQYPSSSTASTSNLTAIVPPSFPSQAMLNQLLASMSTPDSPSPLIPPILLPSLNSNAFATEAVHNSLDFENDDPLRPLFMNSHQRNVSGSGNSLGFRDERRDSYNPNESSIFLPASTSSTTYDSNQINNNSGGSSGDNARGEVGQKDPNATKWNWNRS